MEIKEFFDLYWNNGKMRKLDRYHSFLEDVNNNLYKKFLDPFKKRILVIGIGKTSDARYFAELDREVVAIDISYGGFEGLTNMEKVLMDANRMGFKDSSFDAVFIRTVMLHLNHKRFLSEVKRVLKKGGEFIWIEPLKDNFFLWFYRMLFSPGRLTYTNYLTYKEMLSMKTMFKEFHHKEYYFFSTLLLPLYFLFPSVRSIIRFITWLEIIMLRNMRWLRRFCWISYGYAEV